MERFFIILLFVDDIKLGKISDKVDSLRQNFHSLIEDLCNRGMCDDAGALSMLKEKGDFIIEKELKKKGIIISEKR